ncbi:MAG: helicase-associated domain-containing protein [Treponema sp.]|jgi:hypothetical protein|nr:helicase-associated domain-containing protein [Treponema sp.]
MSGFSFRSPEDWKSALLTLPDSSYFELMRSVFGNIKTPFNKQRLVDDLESFLSKKDIQETIAAYIDERDARVIAAIAILGEPVPGELETFFAGEFSFAELHGILLNLEERLILYRFHGRNPDAPEFRGSETAGVRRLALNPLLEQALGPIISNRNALFPSEPRCASAKHSGAVYGLRDDRILAALFAFVADEPDFFRIEGGIRKKVLEDGKVLFDGLDLEALVGGLQALGLVRQSPEGSGGLVLNEPRLRRFMALSGRERREYLAAGICIAAGAPRPALPLYSRSRLLSLAGFISAFMGTLDPNRQYPRSTLIRLMDMLERSGLGSFALNPRPGDFEFFDSILEALSIAGLLCPGSGDAYFPGLPGESGPAGDAAVIAMDTAFSCILYPEIDFADALSLAFFSLVRETGAAVRFELTRESVVRGFDLGLDADRIIALLDRLSGNQVEQNLRWTIKDWETRYSGVSLFQGLTLVLAEDSRYLAEAEPVSSLISRTLAPGVYLLSAEDRTGAIQALRRAGIDIVAQPPQGGPRPGDRPSPFPPLERASRPLSEGFQPPSDDTTILGESPPDRLRAGLYKERFRKALEKLSLSKAEREELSARIERRLILSESQLATASVRSEKLEARGLDYVGKTSIVKQAIASKQLIEIVWSGQQGEVNRAIGLPNALQKSGGETLLVLKPVPSGDPIRLPLGKIGLLRRVKQSIFGE